MDDANEDEGGGESDGEIDIDGLVNIANNVSASLLKSINTALEHLNNYLRMLNQKNSDANPYISYSSQLIPIEYFSKDFIGKFADYMMKLEKIKKLETVTGYLGKLKAKLIADYDPHTLPFLVSAIFYTRFRFTTTTFYVNKCATSGENLSG